MNLAEILDPHPDDAVALISRGHPTTYGELRAEVAATRAALVALGLEPGDRVAIACANNPQFVVTYWAVLGAGLVAVPLNPLSPRPELQRQLAGVGARALVVGPAGRAVAGELDRAKVPALEHLVVTAGVEAVPGSVCLDEVLAADPAPAPVAVVERADDDLAVLVYTSGTAGHPRAAMLTHGNLAANLEQMLADDTGARDDDVALGVLPTFHIFGLNVVLGGAAKAGAAVLLIERFDPVSAMEAVQNHAVTTIAGVPTMWSAWAAIPGDHREAFASVRLATSGAARLPIETAEAVRERLGLTLVEGYGLTEAAPVVTSGLGQDARPGSIGIPVPGVELRLVDQDGEDVLIGDAGELWVRGPNVFQGYWDDPEASASALTADGWLRTGDVAVVDDEGYLFLVDRAKDLIIVSGFNVFPAEVEEALLEHPAVVACAVVGVAHPHSGEAVKAYVVVEPGAAVEEDDLIEFCATRLARYKCPEKINFVDELPQGLGGKVLRRVLR